MLTSWNDSSHCRPMADYYCIVFKKNSIKKNSAQGEKRCDAQELLCELKLGRCDALGAQRFWVPRATSAGIALRAEAGTLCSAGRATFLGCAGGLLRLERALVVHTTLRATRRATSARSTAQRFSGGARNQARNLRAQRRARKDAQPRFHDLCLIQHSNLNVGL